MSAIDPETKAIVDALMSDPSRERNHFIDQVDMDRVVAALVRLTMEVSVLRDRLDAHESLAAQHNLYTAEDVDGFKPSAEEETARGARRAQLIARLVRDLT